MLRLLKKCKSELNFSLQILDIIIRLNRFKRYNVREII